ncbi:glycosyltransferase family 4 protein [Caminibacter mediatlanticus TB-2]|uniref:Glycosyltransferase family 4 protein n=2 Tax=Caminibacter mediatlanticus TaxID=291048 RepID=A0ABX5VDV5_9BACT|nr:glycosyltransferase family 4 protein [Caminibacter mediatlanticus TB-2]
MHNASGIGTYIKNIVPFLLNNFDITLLAKSEELQNYNLKNKVKVIECNSNIYSIKEQFELFKKIPKCDVFWSPHYNIPVLPIKAKKRIVTIHDVYHLAFYDTLNLKQKLYAKFMINQAVSKSDIILTVSEFSKNEIIKYTNTRKEIKVIYNAINFNKFKVINNNLEKLKNKYSLPNEFILFVGNVKPHKNLKRLLLAIKDLDINLVFVGKKDGFITGDENIKKLITKNNLKERIYFTGYVKDEDIPVIYNLAKLFVFPSLYEGFGIPPLEAQACGCPIIVSNVASLPEVCGDSALYCNPYDVNDIKEKIEVLLNNKQLREELIQKGFENIKRFSWEKSAKKIIDVIEGLK